MVEEKKIPRGYKKTEAGVIPEEWEIKRIGDLLEVHYGKDQRSVKDENGTYPILGSGGQIGWSNEYLYDKESVLIGRKGTIDRPQHTEKPFWTIDTLFYTKIFGNINPKYIYYLFKTINWRSYNEATGVPSLNTTTVESIRVASPPFPEQLAIAEVLSDVDDLINSIESLIDKKQKIKQGAMQELLTGKKRLPGFSGAWERKRLGDVADIKTGEKNNENKVSDGKYPFFVRSAYIERINTFSYEGEAILVPGEGKIGSIFHYINGKFDYHQRVYKISDFKGVQGKFVYYFMKQNFKKHAMHHTVKATVDSLRLPTFQGFGLLLPKSTEEQQAIAEILSDMDSEIETLEEKLKKYRALKQGMMQELLTGRIRLL